MPSVTEQFKQTVKTDGLWAAMRWLNKRVPYRHSAIFAFEGDTLRNICLVDKQDATVTRCGDQAITDSYCVYIHRTAERFAVEEAMLDRRVDGHPKQRNYQCYYGIPLMDSQGKLLGTVCHFDALPIRVTEDVVGALDDLATLIADAAFSRNGPAHFG